MPDERRETLSHVMGKKKAWFGLVGLISGRVPWLGGS